MRESCSSRVALCFRPLHLFGLAIGAHGGRRWAFVEGEGDDVETNFLFFTNQQCHSFYLFQLVGELEN